MRGRQAFGIFGRQLRARCRAQKPHPGSFSLIGWDGTLPLRSH
jgi:hypothetical protein